MVGEMKKEISVTVDHVVQSLRSEKTNPGALANLLNECALRFGNRHICCEFKTIMHEDQGLLGRPADCGQHKHEPALPKVAPK